MNWQEIWATVQNWLTHTGIKLLISIVILIVSFIVINKISKSIEKKGKKKSKLGTLASNRLDATVYRTLSYVVKVILKVLIILALIGYLGIDTSAVSALIASLGVGIGLAVNGTLSNMAGGILLLITHPFKDGDYIASNGFEGTVEDIFICNTKLRTPDNKIIYIPNSKLSSSEITNYSANGTRRVDLTFCISYSNDFDKAKEIIKRIADEHPAVLKDPAPTARVKKHGDNSLEIFSTMWCNTDKYWDVYFDMTENVKKAFDENDISIPFPQLDVHLDK